MNVTGEGKTFVGGLGIDVVGVADLKTLKGMPGCKVCALACPWMK